MSFYNLVSEKQRIVFSVQPKCGCSTIKNWVQEQNGFLDIGRYMITDHRLQSSDYKNYEKLLVVRNLYDRLISFYSLFVIGGVPEDLWVHVDRHKNISLINKSFREMIYILKALPTKNYQHHLIPQTKGIEVEWYDRIVNINDLSRYLEEKELPPLEIINRLDRHDYHRSVVDDTPDEINLNEIPAINNFYADDLKQVVHENIYLDDYILLEKYL